MYIRTRILIFILHRRRSGDFAQILERIFIFIRLVGRFMLMLVLVLMLFAKPELLLEEGPFLGEGHGLVFVLRRWMVCDESFGADEVLQLQVST